MKNNLKQSGDNNYLTVFILGSFGKLDFRLFKNIMLK